MCRGPIYSGPTLVSFLLLLLFSLHNNLSSPGLYSFGPVLLPIYWSHSLVWSVDLLLYSSVSHFSTSCLSVKNTTTSLLSPSLVTLSPTAVSGPSPMTSPISCGLSCHGFACEPSCPTSTLHSHSPQPLLNPFVTLCCVAFGFRHTHTHTHIHTPIPYRQLQSPWTIHSGPELPTTGPTMGPRLPSWRIIYREPEHKGTTDP